MAHAFRERPEGRIACRLEGEEKAVIAQVAQEVADLIRLDLGIREDSVQVREASRSEDPLERLEAEFASLEAQEPTDPAIRRLFPAASEQEDLAAEFRRFGQQDLVSAKLEDLAVFEDSIDSTGPGTTEIELDPEQAMSWLRALTTLRIVIADRLGVQRDGDFETVRMLQQIAERVPEAVLEDESSETAGGDVMIAIYELLSWLQESLIRCL
ncbi:DUF2017 domain-containing protein [Brachybacterium hainanense]|uniref:DUF2017 domain-containing protein n=1 Tax=Brachybacterium hainanense TaxID=1541174 RepID=A0ABV6R9Y5_9MICO